MGCWLVLALVMIPGLVRSQPTGVAILPPSSWVQEVSWRPAAPPPGANQSEGAHYLLVESQQHAEAKEEFHRVAVWMRNETGVQSWGNLTLGFDPSYQQLLLHRVQVHRNGQTLDRLDPSKIKTIQPEAGLNAHLFTGRLNAVIFLEDLRVGDVLEYAFTTRGRNPVLGDHFATRQYIQTTIPIDRQRLRVVGPRDRPLHERQHLIESRPTRVVHGQGQDYLWDFTNQTALAYEDNTPPGFEPYPYWEVSDFASWAQVVDWAVTLYETESEPTPPIRELAGRWRYSPITMEARVRQAVQFVQDDLRYTGIELGPDSYRPSPPAETLGKRFGDCKAKALLLCVLLREMRVEAWPVLVNSFAREAVSRRLPSPFAFDHVIVKLHLDGQAVWVDPTMSHQGGSLTNRYLPPYGSGLVIKAGVKALEAIPPARVSSAQSTVATFRITDRTAPASHSVATTWRGGGADGMRAELARTEREQMERNFLNFSARYYPGVTNVMPLLVTDDRLANVLTITEHYLIRDLWVADQANNRLTASFFADSLDRVLPEPATRLRQFPLRIPHPLRREHQVVVHLPDRTWVIPERKEAIDDEAFYYRYHRKLDGQVVTFRHELETKSGEIPPERVAAYLKKWEQTRNTLGDILHQRDSGMIRLSEINGLMLLVAAAGFTGGGAIGIWCWRRKRRATEPPPLPVSPELSGLGGWLVLVAIGLCVTPFVRLGALTLHWEGYFSMAAWQSVAVPGGDHYHPLYAPLLTGEVLSQTGLLGLNLVLIGMFFTKHRIFPKLYVAMMVINALSLLLDSIVGNLIPTVVEQAGSDTSRELGRAVMHLLIWGSYMLKSRRVKATFVN